MKIIEEKLQNKINRNARFSDVEIDNIEYNSNGAEITISANDERTYSNQAGFGKITFKFLIDEDGRTDESIEYIDYSEEDLAKGASGLQYTELPDEDDPTYWDCVEKIVEEQEEYSRSGDIFQFFELPTNYADCIVDEISESDIRQIFEKYNIKVKSVDKKDDDKFIINVNHISTIYIDRDSDGEYEFECIIDFGNNTPFYFDVDYNSDLEKLIESWIDDFKNIFEPIADLYNQMNS